MQTVFKFTSRMNPNSCTEAYIEQTSVDGGNFSTGVKRYEGCR